MGELAVARRSVFGEVEESDCRGIGIALLLVPRVPQAP